jgi:hypothetical protein
MPILVGRTLPYRFVPNDGTMQQLKKLRSNCDLIRNRAVVDSISKIRTLTYGNMLGQYAVEENQDRTL